MKNTVKAPKRKTPRRIIMSNITIPLWMVERMSQKSINEACRDRGIPIPKEKSVAALRLQKHLIDHGARGTFTIA